jgi:hypothetical protein
MFGSSLSPVVCRRAFVLLCVMCLSIVISNVLSYHMSLRSEFHIVMSVTISALVKGKQFLLLIRHQPCYSYIPSSPVKVLVVIEERKNIRKK